MKSLLSLEGLRPPLSRDSSTYAHAMSYFATVNNNRSIDQIDTKELEADLKITKNKKSR